MAEEVTMYKCEECGQVHETEAAADACCRIEAPPMLPAEDQNIDSLRQFAKGHIAAICDGGRIKDDEHYAYETVMQAFYGPDIFKWINKHAPDY